MDGIHDSPLSLTTPQTTLSDAVSMESRKYPEFVRYAALIVGIPIMLASIVGNALTIVAVLKTKSLRTGTNIFIISLSTFDLSYSLIVMPTVMTIHWNNAWVFGDVYCKLFPMIFFTLVGEGLVSLSGIAVTRYLKIIHPKTFDAIFQKRVRVALLLCFFWIQPILALLPAMTGVWGTLGYEPKALTCTFLRDGSSYNTFLLITGYALQIILISICYLCILCKVCANHRKVASLRRVNTTGGASRAERKEQREDLRYTKMMVTIFVIFLLAYSPYMINNLLDPDLKNMGRGFLCASCVWLSVCLNPVVYVLFNRQFRQAFLTILPFRCGQCTPSVIESSSSMGHTSSTT